ncbi:hematopoietic progenitor cell antigen CD34 [Anomaloglossus baeobatrachus]|uniref:hematopoietic progenitor cell antigen CD34 n=1 Tax=Anomaloglossus baeobatrachus TaxID=238106 RepID=UPI003F4F96D2
MLPCNLRTWTKGEILLLMSILTWLDVTETTSTIAPTTQLNSVEAIVSTQTLKEIKPTTVTVHSSTTKQPSVTSPRIAGPTISLVTVSGKPSTTLATTKEPHTQSSTPTQVPQGIFTTLTSEATDSRNLVVENSENTTSSITEPTTQSVQSTNATTSATTQQSAGSQGSQEEAIVSQATAAPSSITCLGLGNLSSTSQVACFQYEEETTCEKLDKKRKEDLRSFLCDIMSTTVCNVTVHASEVQPKCILWVPTSKEAKDKLQNETYTAINQLPTQMKWGQISEHQTRSQKTMIALVTCGVLLAAFILAGYFLSNRESWSPGRQRLGEDPYCTETDSQGNTLVSVSSHPQDKPNSGTQENGTGQTVSPTATNGHSTKKQNVSDTEL